jgi:hypothetical protein
VDIEILDPATERIHFAYEIERGVRFHTDRSRSSASSRAETREWSSSTTTSSDGRRRSVIQG